MKNDVELFGARACHVRDAAALCSFLAWLESLDGALPDEIEASDWLEAARRKQVPISRAISMEISFR